MMRKLRYVNILVMLAGLLLGGVGLRGASAAPLAQAGGQTYVVYVGYAIVTVPGDKPAWQAMKFYPSQITINEGDSILFKHNAFNEPHNVALLGPDNKFQDLAPAGPGGAPAVSAPSEGAPGIDLNPLVVFPQGGNTFDNTKYVTSGLMAGNLPGPKEWKLTFTKAGTFQFMCEVHSGVAPDGSVQGMTGKVTVQAAGSTAPKTPAQVESDNQAAMAADKATAMADGPQVTKAAASKPGPNGTTVYTVQAGWMDMNAMLEYQRFIPSKLTIKQGDSVEWESMAFHTVTFGPDVPLIQMEAKPSGPPRVFMPLQVAAPAGGPTYTGTGFTNSGILAPPPNAAPGTPATYKLTFTTAGTFAYRCTPHDENGMTADIVVTAGSAMPGMPRTGSGSESALPLAGLFAALMLVGAGVVLRRRQAGMNA